MILAQNWPKIAKSLWHCSFNTGQVKTKKNSFKYTSHVIFSYKYLIVFHRKCQPSEKYNSRKMLLAECQVRSTLIVRPAFVQNNYFTEAQIYLIQLDKIFCWDCWLPSRIASDRAEYANIFFYKKHPQAKWVNLNWMIWTLQGSRLTFQLASPVASERSDSLAKTNFSLVTHSNIHHRIKSSKC